MFIHYLCPPYISKYVRYLNITLINMLYTVGCYHINYFTLNGTIGIPSTQMFIIFVCLPKFLCLLLAFMLMIQLLTQL